jgi:ABC-2 type transport system permease protein
MLKLIKYDWMSRWKLFLGAIAVAIILNIDIMRRILAEDSSEPSMFTFILFMAAFAMAVILGVDHIRRMYTNLFTEEGQFLFSTPLSGYEILGGKLSAIVAECIGILLLMGLIGFIDYQILVNKFPQISLYGVIPTEYIPEMFKGLLLILIGYISFLLTVYLSMALTKSIFSHIRYGKLLSFIFFIIISSITGYIAELFLKFPTDMFVMELNKIPSIYILLNFIMAAILFTATGYLLDKKINL